MRKATVSSVKAGMATVVYSSGEGEASNPIPILAHEMNRGLKAGDRVVVAALDGKKDGIVLGKFWNKNNRPE